jgi:threonine dehydratase
MACRTPDATALSILQSAGVRVIEVTDAQVADALRVCFSATHNVAEGAGAAGLAALLAAPERSVAEVCGTVLYGGNRFSAVFVRVLAEGGAA